MGCGSSKPDAVVPQLHQNGVSATHLPVASETAPLKTGFYDDKKAQLLQKTDPRVPEKPESVIAPFLSVDGKANEQPRKQLMSVTPLEIDKHNEEVGCMEWIPFKGKVYDGNGFKAFFPNYVATRDEMMEARRQQRASSGEDEEETEYVTTFYTGHMYKYVYLPALNKKNNWGIYHAIYMLRRHFVTEEEIAEHISQFLIGHITGTSGRAYWQDIRNDILGILGELSSMSEEELTPGERDYFTLLTRWQQKYASVDPPIEPTRKGDPNEQVFPEPDDPESLRLWLLTWQPFDCELPEDGAWPMLEANTVELVDTHECFAGTLRLFSVTEDFIFGIDGEAAWETLPADVVKEDLMTAEQEQTHQSREKRTDLHDPERMRRRREELCEYFVRAHKMDVSAVQPFLAWAGFMEENKKTLEELCESN